MIQAPEGMNPSQAPPSFSTRSSVATHTFSCASVDDQSVKCSHVFLGKRNRWPATEQANVRAMYDKIVEADRTTFAFERSKAGAAGGH